MNGSSENKHETPREPEPDTLNLGGKNIPEETQEVIRCLMSEIKALRERIEANNDRIVELKTLADRYPLVPVVNLRAFVRELGRAKAYAEWYGVPTTRYISTPTG